MPRHVKVGPVRQVQRITPQQTVEQAFSVEYFIGEDGPFLIILSPAEFTGARVNEEINKVLAELDKLKP